MSEFLEYKAAVESGRYLCPKELIGRYNVSRSWVYKEIEAGRLPVVRFGRRILVEADKLPQPKGDK